MRRQFRLRSLWLADASRGQILRLHRDLGMLAALLVLLFAMTGAGVVFYDVSRSFLNALLSPGAVAPTAPAVTAATPVPPPDARTIARASARLPGGQLMSWSPPVQGSAVHLFRFRMPGEPHPFGRSTVHVDGRNGALLQVRDATQAARGERALHWLYPLHTARVGGWPYRAGVLLGGLALAILCLSGLLGFVRSFKARAAR
jgi:uncharacterized iron-regulated membrane protein